MAAGKEVVLVVVDKQHMEEDIHSQCSQIVLLDCKQILCSVMELTAHLTLLLKHLLFPVVPTVQEN
jgi:hypothetical protein